jgi:Icc-related predicted phosphoesterase
MTPVAAHPHEGPPVRVLCLSDLHGWLPKVLPDCDVVVIAGDICPTDNHTLEYQRRWMKSRFRPWLDQLGVPVVWTFGNHDFIGEHAYEVLQMRDWKVPPLLDENRMVCNLRFHASPWSPTFGDWAFMDSDERLDIHWQKICQPVDVLITHTPAWGIGDLARLNGHAGSKSLVPHLMDLAPRLHVCGHIHEAAGVHPVSEATVSLNASVRRLDYSVRGIAWMATVGQTVEIEVVDLERDYWQPRPGMDAPPWGLLY